MALLSPYHYGKYKWDNYLLDIQGTIESGDAAHRQSVQLQADALDATHEQVEELRQQTEQLRHIQEALQSGFEGLRAEFEWGFTLMVDRMDTQIKQLSQIAAQLDAIHNTLLSPLLTQARELFQLGQEHFRKGLLDKALEAYLKAEQKNEVDFPLQLQIGKLFLYGRDEDDDVIDLPQAEKHLLLAARYANVEKTTFSQWNEYCGQAYFHAAVAAYLIGEQEQDQGRPALMQSCLERALRYLAKAAVLWPRFTEIVYTQAKCYALLGQVQDAAQKLEILSDRDRRYFAKASQDGDFETFRAGVEELFRRATISPGPLARATQAKLDEVAETIAWAKRSAPTSKEDLEAIESSERELAIARQSLPTLDVDIEGLNERVLWLRAELEKIALRSFQNNIDVSQKAIAALDLRKTYCENSIKQLKRTMKSASGTGMGCLFSFLFFVGVVYVFGLAVNFSKQVAPTVAWTAVATAIVGGLLGSKISRNRQNLPHKRAIEENSRGIDECIQSLPRLRQQVEGWQQKMRSFMAWQAQRRE